MTEEELKVILDDHYEPWEWQPLERMPHGCCEVVVRLLKGQTEKMCSCDYWWDVSKGNLSDATSFRHSMEEEKQND